MSDFGATGLVLQVNLGSQASPSWTALQNGGSLGNNEIRASDSGGVSNNTPSSLWTPTQRPGATALLPYLDGYTSDGIGSGILATTPPGLPTAFDRAARWLQTRISWDASGIFGS